MKKVLPIILALAMLLACNNDHGNDQKLEDPLKTEPVTDAIPDTMKLVKDSVIVPETAPGAPTRNTGNDTLKNTK